MLIEGSYKRPRFVSPPPFVFVVEVSRATSTKSQNIEEIYKTKKVMIEAARQTEVVIKCLCENTKKCWVKFYPPT